jgi:hypothetical protein
VRDRQKDRRGDLEKKDELIAKLNARITTLQEIHVEIRNTINRLAQNNQLYRTAAFIFGREVPADVEQSELLWVTAIWFGSLAAITAFTGTLLAFGGLILKYGSIKFDTEPKHASNFAKLINSYRRLLVAKRKRLREPQIKYVDRVVEKSVEVVKEIPVEKVAIKEVPKEIIRKELVHVPVYTNDPRLLRNESGVRIGLDGKPIRDVDTAE